MKNYAVRAVRWRRGWELHVEDLGVTQVHVLSRAEEEVRDFLATALGGEPEEYTNIDIVADLGGYETEVRKARVATASAAQAHREAGERTREVVAKLRGDGLSLGDIAVILGVTRGRVQQLVG